MKMINIEQLAKEYENVAATVVTDEETVPCVITNRALQMAAQMGVTKTSLVTDLMNLSTSKEGKVNDLDDFKILQTIYVGYLGGELLRGKDGPKYTFEEFIDVYNASTIERTIVYNNLLVKDENNFKKGIENSTRKGLEKGEKK